MKNTKSLPSFLLRLKTKPIVYFVGVTESFNRTLLRLTQLEKRIKNERADGSGGLRAAVISESSGSRVNGAGRDASGTRAKANSKTPRAISARGASGARNFSTVVHRLAQASRANLVDAADGKIYFARRLNRKLEDLTVRLGLGEFLNGFAVLSATGKLEDFTRRRRLRRSLTAIAESS